MRCRRCVGLMSPESQRPMTDQPMNLLFLCTHNSARSIIAESITNFLGCENFKGFSAGSQPSGQVHPLALDLLRRLNYDTSNLRSKTWNEFAAAGAPPINFVITVCDDTANETCPIWLGHPMVAHWGLPDPSRAKGTEAEQRQAFANAHRILYQRIRTFMNLPFEALDELTLQNRLDEIGRKEAAPNQQDA